MNNENIIGINVANAISITIMGAIGAVLLMAVRKSVMGKRGAPVTNAPQANFVS